MKILEALCGSGHLSIVDICLARELLRETVSENAAALICHLSLAVRRGHLCIEIDPEVISPDPLLTWSENQIVEEGDRDEVSAKDLLQQIPRMITLGAQELPSTLLSEVSNDLGEISAVQTPLCRSGNRFYFQRYWFYETSFLTHFRDFVSTPPRITLDKDLMTLRIEKMVRERELLPEQGAAILNTCDDSLTILCGGPGTGKTYTAGKLICLLWEALATTHQEKFEIALAAPTGKAAANLQKSLSKAADGVKKLENLQAKTLHALLNIKSSGSIAELAPLPFDLVIVDESSMIDVRLMAALFTAMKPGGRLILLGDSHQLPAVEAGSLFADLVDVAAVEDAKFKVCKLEKCLRAELQGILDVASTINQGNAEGVLRLFEQGKEHPGINRLEFDGENLSDSAIAKKICRYAFESYQLKNLHQLNHLEILNHFNRFRLLSPLRKGLFGVEEINRLIGHEHGSTCPLNGTFVAPIMLLKNDYRLELFNGEVGALIRPAFNGYAGGFDLQRGDYAVFVGKEGQVKQIPALLLPAFEFAYCLSVHKSQGSEFEHLLLLLPPGSECFGRELLYTAVTRARKQLTLWADNATLAAATCRKSFRLSGIRERLANYKVEQVGREMAGL